MKTKKQIFRKSKVLVGTGLLLLILMVSLVSAGIGFRQVVEVYPGESHIENLRLQNLAPDGPDMIFRGEIVEGGNVVSFSAGSEFDVPNGQIVDAPLSIMVPEDTIVGQTYTVKMIFRSSPSTSESVGGEGSALQFVTGNGISFDVKVVEKPETEKPAVEIGTMWIILGILAIIVVIIVIWFILKKRKEMPAEAAKPVKLAVEPKPVK